MIFSLSTPEEKQTRVCGRVEERVMERKYKRSIGYEQYFGVKWVAKEKRRAE